MGLEHIDTKFRTVYNYFQKGMIDMLRAKRMICTSLAALMVLAATGCRPAESPDIPETTHPTSVTEPTPADPTVPEDTITTAETTLPTEATVPEETAASTEPATQPSTEPTEAPTEPVETTVATEPVQTNPAHRHSYIEKVTAPSCEADGYTTYTCSCGDSYTSDIIAATRHQYGEWYTTQEPTETTTGTAVRKCSVCDNTEIKTLGKVTADHQHSYTSAVATAATCESAGVMIYTCSCGDSYTESISKKEHSYYKQVWTADCNGEGVTIYRCTRCDYWYAEDRVPALGHDYNVVSSAEATCTSDGHVTYQCSRCSDSYTETTPGGHNWEHTHHTDEIGHWEKRTLVCRCGWTCAESKASSAGYELSEYWYFNHVLTFEQDEQRNHSYDTTATWIVDIPASDTWTCSKCGETANTKP